MLKKLITLSSVSLFLHGSGGQPALPDLNQQAKSAEAALITQTKKSEPEKNTVLSAVTAIKPIQDIIVSYINSWNRAKNIRLPVVFKQKRKECTIRTAHHAYSPDGKSILLVSQTNPYQIVVYDTALQNQKMKIQTEPGEYFSSVTIRYSADGKYVAIFSKNIIHIRDAHTLQLLKKIKRANFDCVEDLQFLKDAAWLVLAVKNKKDPSYDRFYYCKWNEQEPKVVTPEIGSKKLTYCVLVSPAGDHLIEAPTGTGSIIVWDLKSNKQIASPMICKLWTNYVFTMAYSPSGVYFSAASADQDFICIYDTKTYSELAKIEFIDKYPTTVAQFLAFSPDDKYLVCATSYQIFVYDIKSKKIIFTYNIKNKYALKSLSYDPNGTSFTACLRDRISIFEPPTLE